MMEFIPFNVNKKVGSLGQFLPYMNEEGIFDSFHAIKNIIASNIVRAVSYLHSRDIVRKDIKPAKVLMPSSHCKRYKHQELEMAFDKKPIFCKFGDLGEAKSMYTQNNTLTSKNRTTTVHMGSIG